MIVFYILYLFSGIIKALSNYYGIHFPIDITLFTAILLILNIFIDIIRNRLSLKIQKNIIFPLIFLLLFFLWIIISLTYTISEVYSLNKTVLFLTNIVAFLYPILINKFSVKRFLILFIFSGIIFFVWFYNIYFNLKGNILHTEIYKNIMGLSLSLAIFGGLALLVIISSELIIFKNEMVKIMSIILLAAFLIFSGARGPILFFVVCILMFVLYKLPKIRFFKNINSNKLVKYIFIFVPTLTAILIYIFIKFNSNMMILYERTIKRFVLLFNGGSKKSMGDSVNVRLEQIEFSLESIFDNFQNFLVGYGFGSFGPMYLGKDVRSYPHNVFLEVWFELGFIGLILFLAFLISIYLNRIHAKRFVISIVLIYIILNVFKSSSIIDMRIFFAFFGVYLINNKAFANE